MSVNTHTFCSLPSFSYCYHENRATKELCNYVSFYDSHFLRDYKYVFSNALLHIHTIVCMYMHPESPKTLILSLYRHSYIFQLGICSLMYMPGYVG